MKKQLSVFDVASESWSLVNSNKKLLLVMMSIYTLTSFVTAIFDPRLNFFHSMHWGVSVFLYAVTLIISTLIIWVVMINVYHIASGNTHLGWGVWRDYPRSHYWRMLGVTLVWILATLVVILIIGAIITGILFGFGLASLEGISPSIAPFMFLAVLAFYVGFAYFLLRYLFAVWVALFEGKKVFESFSFSSEMTKGVKWRMIGGYLLAVLAMMGIMFIFTIPMIGGTMLLGSYPFIAYAIIAVFSIVFFIVYMLVICWWTMGMFVTFVKLRNQTQGLSGIPEQTDDSGQEDQVVIEVEMVEEGNQTN